MKRIINTATEKFIIWMSDIYGERADWFRRNATIDEMETYGKTHKWMILEIIADNGKRVEWDSELKAYVIEEE